MKKQQIYKGYKNDEPGVFSYGYARWVLNHRGKQKAKKFYRKIGKHREKRALNAEMRNGEEDINESRYI